MSKLEIQIGEIKFSVEGDEKWLSEELEKIITKVPELLRISPPPQVKPAKVSTPKTEPAKTSTATNTSNTASTLAGFLKEKSATTSQAKKFLATAVYLHKNGMDRISTRDVSKALKDARHTKLTNPSDCLNQQVKKGYCEKDGASFYVTPEGESSI